VRPVEELWQTVRSRAHGAVRAVRVAMQRLGFESLIASRASPERDAVCAMVAARVLAPHTKLATTRWWHTTTLAEDYGVADQDEAICMQRWTGCSNARSRSRRSSRLGTSRRGAGTLRPEFELLRGQQLSAGEDRLQPRRQAQHAAGQLRALDDACGLPGSHLGLRGQHGRCQHADAAGRSLRRHFGSSAWSS